MAWYNWGFKLTLNQPKQMKKIPLTTCQAQVISVAITHKGLTATLTRIGTVTLRPQSQFILLQAAQSPLAKEFVPFETVQRLSESDEYADILEEFEAMNSRFLRLAPMAIQRRIFAIRSMDLVISSYPLIIDGEVKRDREGDPITYWEIDGMSVNSSGIVLTEDEEALL